MAWQRGNPELKTPRTGSIKVQCKNYDIFSNRLSVPLFKQIKKNFLPTAQKIKDKILKNSVLKPFAVPIEILQEIMLENVDHAES